MNRGDVYVVRLDPVEGSEQAGVRPAVVISRNAVNQTRPVAIVIPCTSYKGRPLLPSHAFLSAGSGGLELDTVVLGEQIRVVSHRRIMRYMGSLNAAELHAVEDALRIALDLD